MERLVSSPRRVAVVGLPGSGKSTLARRIGERLSLPVVHLDAHFFLPEWKPRPEDEWTPMARQLVEADAWVMDGAFAMELALERADTIIQLDFPRWRGLLGSVRRNLSGRRSPPADFASGCRERFDRQFLQLFATSGATHTRSVRPWSRHCQRFARIRRSSSHAAGARSSAHWRCSPASPGSGGARG